MRPERKPWITALQGSLVAVASFAALGTVSAVWENPFFIRMTPSGGWEIGLLAALSILMGLYVIVRIPVCSSKSVTAGGIIGFVGIACPICNQILLLIFGSELLLTYFEPVRIYVAALGVVITAWAVWRAWQGRREMVVSLP
ncbi:MAG TPA: hypothetical protein ENI69_09290 [Rhodospirillales bacterium]|nr:hypothetical protein [Rhodospirillales bacterium]